MTRWLLAALAAVVAVALYVRYLEARLIFFPMRGLEGSPRDIGVPDFEEVHFTASDGVRLHGWFLLQPEARWTLLFCHGNAGNISHRLDKLRLLYGLGAQVFIFDYRGYGRSEGRPSEQGAYRDAEAAWQYLVDERKLAPASVVLYGESLGGAVATELALRVQPRALILEDSFTSIRAMTRIAAPWTPAFLLRTTMDVLAKLPRVQIPILIIHSVNDEIVPFAQGEALYAAARTPKTLLKLRGGHNTAFLDSQELYVEGLRAFLASLQ